MPLFERPLSAAAVRLNGLIYFFDGGEGVQMSCKRVHLGFRAISVIAVTHLHADHCLGIPGVLMMRARSDDPGPLTVLGPPGIKRFILDVKRDLAFYTNYEIRFVEWDEDQPAGAVAYEDEQVTIRWGLMQHTTRCLGYMLEEHDRPGKFNEGRAVQLGIPKGPLWGKLQRGESIVLENGVTVTPDQVLGERRRGRRFAYVTDTLANKNLYKMIAQADLAFIEGMFLSPEAETAKERMHLTSREAGRLCERAGVSRAVLIHVSPRYTRDMLSELEAEAKDLFPSVEMGRAGSIYTVPFPD